VSPSNDHRGPRDRLAQRDDSAGTGALDRIGACGRRFEHHRARAAHPGALHVDVYGGGRGHRPAAADSDKDSGGAEKGGNENRSAARDEVKELRCAALRHATS
jgi:hypothetical protein